MIPNRRKKYAMQPCYILVEISFPSIPGLSCMFFLLAQIIQYEGEAEENKWKKRKGLKNLKL